MSSNDNETGTNNQNDTDEPPKTTDTRRGVTSRRSLLMTGGALGFALPGLSLRARGSREQPATQQKDEGCEPTTPSADPLQTSLQASELQKLTASDGAVGDVFGWSVAVADDVAFVGARGDDDAGSESGSAYVFRFDGSQWIQEQKLTASDGALSFGSSMAVTDDVALIGAPFDDDTGSRSGSAYVFRFDGSQWIEEQKLTASDGAANDQFGWSVAVADDVALVGARLDDDAGSESGSVYVFRFNGNQWTEEQKLTASDGTPNDVFGWSVGVADDVALIGAALDDSAKGSAYVFRFDGSQWVQEQKLTASDGATGDTFGSSMAVADDVALVGAPRDDDSGTDSGSAYVFRFDGSQWIEEQKLTASDGAASDQFGWSVAVADDVALVGAHLDDDAGTDSGSAYVFRFDGSQWIEEQKLTASDGAAGDRFGSSVAVADNVALIGAIFGDGTANNSGAVYVFDLQATPFPEPITLPNGTQLTPVDADGDGLYEDLDGDGDTDGQDVALLAQLVTAYRRGEITLTDAQVAALDFNSDGALTMADINTYVRQQM